MAHYRWPVEWVFKLVLNLPVFILIMHRLHDDGHNKIKYLYLTQYDLFNINSCAMHLSYYFYLNRKHRYCWYSLSYMLTTISMLLYRLFITRHVFVKHGCPRRQPSPSMAKISKSYILTPPHPQGHEMSVKCEEPIDELTVQVWLLYHHPNFRYCTLFESGTELRTDG